MLLGDRTGEVDAKMWDNVAEVVETFERDDFVKVKGLLQIFQNRLQMTIHKMARVLDARRRFRRFFPGLDARSRGNVRGAQRALVAGMRNPHLRALLLKHFWTMNRWRACIARRRPPNTCIMLFWAG